MVVGVNGVRVVYVSHMWMHCCCHWLVIGWIKFVVVEVGLSRLRLNFGLWTSSLMGWWLVVVGVDGMCFVYVPHMWVPCCCHWLVIAWVTFVAVEVGL